MRLIACLFWLLLVWASPCLAEPIGAQQAARLALQQSPEVLPARMRAERAGAIVSDAATPSALAPTVALGAGVRRNADAASRPEVTLSFWQPLRLDPVGTGRTAHATALTETMRAEQARIELDLSRDVLSQWIELRYWESVEGLRRRAVERAERLHALVVAQVAVGAVVPGDDALALLTLGGQRVRLLEAQVERESAMMALRLLLGAPELVLTTRGDLQLPQREGPRSHPSSRMFFAQAKAQSAAADLELLEAQTPMALGLSLTREGTGDWLFLGQVSVPLGSGNTASYAAAQTRRDVRALEFEATHAQERMKHLGGDLRRQLEVRTRMVEHVQRSELAPARKASTIIDHQFRAGKVPLHALLAVRDTVFHAEVQALQVQKELALTQIRLAWVEGWLASWVKGEL